MESPKCFHIINSLYAQSHPEDSQTRLNIRLLIQACDIWRENLKQEGAEGGGGWGLLCSFLIRIPSSVISPQSFCLTSRGLLIAPGNIIDPDLLLPPVPPPLLAAVKHLRSAAHLRIPPLSDLDTRQDTAAHTFKQGLHWLCAWPGLTFNCSCNEPYTHTHSLTHTCSRRERTQFAVLRYHFLI